MLRDQGSFKSEIYGEVFEGEVERATDLERIFQLFNWVEPDFMPCGYYGHSLSVSDVVGIKNPQTNAWSYHYCDVFGFKKIEFDEEAAERIF